MTQLSIRNGIGRLLSRTPQPASLEEQAYAALLYLLLCRNLRMLFANASPATPVPNGLADTAGVRDLHAPEGISELASLAPMGAWQQAHRITYSHSYRAFFRRLDEFVESTGTAIPTFMKIDVEGAENLVLDGAATCSARNPGL